ncbi:hypothetical protein CORC01_07154 [Colletotrichum orchidophilum]|uniref:Uncharacterized protein n=1 Tax=Colletotrichum orchidophilum TaxID=1209926 RepID=A0A1G4B7W4_9PEZI|nr:uncharacterized protein CORC01_07154 [Colletotrichum orchidophilum]OHE97539.1 hypothetical protein CORC01_07154 [Colletotrichum orchidophilum]
MPALTHAELAIGEPRSTVGSYHHVSFSHLCTGLLILAVLVVLRLVVCGAFLTTVSNEIKEVRGHQQYPKDRLDHLVNQQRLHHLFVQDGGWVMEEKSRGVSSNTLASGAEPTRKISPQDVFMRGNEKDSTEDTETSSSGDVLYGDHIQRGKALGHSPTKFMVSRPPQPPPLTPLELSPSAFTYDERRRSFTSGVSELDASFFEQPNPDYMSSTSTGTSTATQDTQTTRSFPAPRRRSYTKTLPIGISSQSSFPILDDDIGIVFSPSSYPPTSPLLPGPPPIHGEIRYDEVTKQEILVRGEIISLLDDSGAGWKRHTRVYGGGACLACAASGDDGHQHGGFYGENVLPEEKRY